MALCLTRQKDFHLIPSSSNYLIATIFNPLISRRTSDCEIKAITFMCNANINTGISFAVLFTKFHNSRILHVTVKHCDKYAATSFNKQVNHLSIFIMASSQKNDYTAATINSSAGQGLQGRAV